MDVALKQRLVGATVLVALAVIVLPMLLGGRPEEGSTDTQRIELPPQPGELDFETRRFPVGEQPTSQDGGPAREAGSVESASAAPGPRDVAHVELEPRDFADALEPPGANTGEVAESAAESDREDRPEDDQRSGPAEVPAEPASKPSPEAVQAAAPQPPVAAEPLTGRYVVQVASFGSRENATRLTKTLGGYGYAVLSDVVSSDVGQLHRVRVGPYDGESDARKAAARLKTQVDGVNPRVVDLRPDQAAQVTEPADPLVRWVVQAGSFGTEANADGLVEKLRGLGLSAYKESLSSAGATVYRVRAGPFVEREEAIRANELANSRLQLNGVVMSAD